MAQSTISAKLILLFKEQFIRYGTSEVLTTDNGLQFTTQKFTDFTQEWEFKHVSSSPQHSRSNGKTECAVKVIKSLLKKAMSDSIDPCLTLLDYRNTSTAGMKINPSQQLMSRMIRKLVTVSQKLLYPEV